MTTFRRPMSAAVVTLAVAASIGLTAFAGPAQHGPGSGHLLGSGDFGSLELVGVLQLTDVEGTVADLAVSPDGRWAYVANAGDPDCAAPAEAGGRTAPAAGVWVVDLADLEAPRLEGLVPFHQDSRPGEGVQVLSLSTRFFSGEILVLNSEPCGKNGKGGVVLWDVRDPRKPLRLGTYFGDRGRPDALSTHSVFAWDTGDTAYVVLVNDSGSDDLDIIDITNPRRPHLIAEYSFTSLDLSQPEMGLRDAFPHDVVVKEIGASWIMLSSYWDGGHVLLDVTDPTAAVVVGDTDYESLDPLLFERTGIALTPEGNAHQAEFTADDRFFIGTDEDSAPYRLDLLELTGGPHQGTFPTAQVPGAASVEALPDMSLDGFVVYGGYGCPGSAPIPPADLAHPGGLTEGEERILVLQRGPFGDPSAPEEACFPGEKAERAIQAGWDAVLFVEGHAAAGTPFCGAGGFPFPIVGVCTSHEAFHKMFDTPASTTYPDGPAIGSVGERIEVGLLFDGWGYVHLHDAATLQVLDVYAIPEAHEPAYGTGFGDLSVHEVATHPLDPHAAYLAYYAGGIRAIAIQCSGSETDTCSLVETGGYLSPDGNNFWGIEVIVRDAQTYVLGSDIDRGLWILRDDGT